MNDQPPASRDMAYRMQRVRECLQDVIDGVTAAELAALQGYTVRRAEALLYRLPDAYIDRWQATDTNTWEAIWCISYAPPHSPRPTTQPNRT